MKKLFYSHPDTVIAALALIFLGILLAFYLWAIGDIYTEVNLALNFSPPTQADGFDFAAASSLDLRGLLDGPSTAPTP